MAKTKAYVQNATQPNWGSVSCINPTKPIKVSPGKRHGLSWGLIIVLLVFFFPAGMIAAVYKLHAEPEKCIYNGKGCEITGWVFLILFLVFGVGSFASLYTVIVSLIMCIISVLILMDGRKYKDYGWMARQYLVAIAASQDGNAEEIAKALKTSWSVASANIQSLIENGFLPDSSLDVGARRLSTPSIRKAEQEKKKMRAARGETVRVICCPSCGAMNRIEPGEPAVCEYCQSPLA